MLLLPTEKKYGFEVFANDIFILNFSEIGRLVQKLILGDIQVAWPAHMPTSCIFKQGN